MKPFTRWINRTFKYNPRKKLPLVMGSDYEPQTFGQPVERNQNSLMNTRDAEKYFRPSRIPIKNTLVNKRPLKILRIFKAIK